MFKEDNLNSFLTLGYFLNYKRNRYLPLPETNPDYYKNSSINDLVITGSKLLLDIFSENFNSNKKHLVPLSGGLDSRVIIGGLLELTNSNNINTFTFGVPGSFDYDIGRLVAKECGISNTLIDLEKQEFSHDLLLDAARRFDHQTYLFYHPDYRWLEEKFPNHDYWSGFLGGEAAGSHFPKWEKSDTAEYEIKEKFLSKNRFVKSIYLANKREESLIPLLGGVNNRIENLSYYEQVDFFNRQTKYIAPHVCPIGFNVITPFSSKKWLEFILSVPQQFRRNMILYKQIIHYTFPKLFSYPTKDNFGLPLKVQKKRIYFRKKAFEIGRSIGLSSIINKKKRKYFDFSNRIRSDENLKKLVVSEVNDLKERDYITWLNLDDILKTHFDNRADHGKAIQVLSSLEIILKSLKM